MALPNKNPMEGIAKAVVLVKAAPHASVGYGETVCCAGITLEGQWVRIYPVQFRYLEQAQKFSRWDLIRFSWRLPKDDKRSESRRVSHEKIEIVGSLPKKERTTFLYPHIVTSLKSELAAGRTLALLRPRDPLFTYKKRNPFILAGEKEKLSSLDQQPDLLNAGPLIAREPCPYEFRYAFKTDDGESKHLCLERDAISLDRIRRA
jgi:hypothetical protein